MSALPPTKTEVRTWAFGALTDQAAEWTRAEETVTTEYGTINLQLADSPGFGVVPLATQCASKARKPRLRFRK